MKKTGIIITLIILAVWAIALAVPYFVLGQGIIPQRQQAGLFGGGVPQAGNSGAAIPAGVDLYALGANQWIYVKRSCDPDFRALFAVRLFSDQEQLIGIDFRPSDGQLYGISDNGTIYTIGVNRGERGNVVRISATNPRFAGGLQSLADFNPVVDALRLIGTNDQNFAVVNSGGNLNVTAMQTKITYAAGDANQSQDPNLTGGSYTNNRNGAAVTLFYGLDYDLDTLVTIDPAQPGGSSATGGGQLRTIGKLQFFNGNPVNISPTADLDIFTDSNGVNTLIGITGRTLFTVRETDLPYPQLGATNPVQVRASGLSFGGFVDVAAAFNGGRCRRGYDD